MTKILLGLLAGKDGPEIRMQTMNGDIMIAGGNE